MIPGPTIYYKCPICELLSSTGSLVSGNTIGSRLFSDGKSISPMLPEFPVMNKCQDCNHSFWLNDSTKFNGEISENALLKRFFQISRICIIYWKINFMNLKMKKAI